MQSTLQFYHFGDDIIDFKIQLTTNVFVKAMKRLFFVLVLAFPSISAKSKLKKFLFYKWYCIVFIKKTCQSLIFET